ncbi:hypothetical protein ACFZDG_01720 [Kitasatospora xanthocidica]|uniref:hypothetical protein n=1 Tax=Kitasatospora xanthocidica TaxID=83382 RepID=UPI0036EDB4C6
MARTVRHPSNGSRAAAHHNRQVAWTTGVLLLAVSLYTVTIGPNGWLWFGWAVLLLVCVGLFLVHP